MDILKDYRGSKIRLTEERKAHILEHPEMEDMQTGIHDTLLNPQCVVQSASDAGTNLYYRYYAKTAVRGKYLCVVVKIAEDDMFVLTAYLTNKIKRGEILWEKKT